MEEEEVYILIIKIRTRRTKEEIEGDDTYKRWKCIRYWKRSNSNRKRRKNKKKKSQEKKYQ